MSLVSHASDDLSISIGSIRTGIKDAMDDDSLLDPNNPQLSEITRVVYLGDSEESVLNFGVVIGGDSMGAAGGGGGGGAGGAGGGGGGDSSGIDASTSGRDNDRNGIFIPIVTTAVVGTALLALLLLLLRRRRTVMTQRQLDYGAAVAQASDDVSASSSFSMSDPEGAFHQGYYHYTKDGVRYLSQFCTTCRETERQLAMGQGLETISEDEQYHEGRNRLVEANSKDLGGMHSTMDFHTCTSATCPCRDRERDVTFIPWLSTRAQTSDVTETTNVVSNTKSSKSGRSMEV